MVEISTKKTKKYKKLKINTLVEGFSFKNNKGQKTSPKKVVLL